MSGKNLKILMQNFPEHCSSINELLKTPNVYVETSAFNYLVDEFSLSMIGNSRDFIQSTNQNWLISPVTLWEILLTSDDSNFDKLVLLAQNLFSPYLLATPSELAVRYLEHAYPDNKVNYSFLSSTRLSKIWEKMTKSDMVTFQYDKEQLKAKTSIYRKISKNIPYLLSGGTARRDDLLDALSRILKILYECMKIEGFDLPENPDLVKLTTLYILLLMVFFTDFESSEVKEFWCRKNLSEANCLEKSMYIIGDYPNIFRRGPFLEMANMVYYQYKVKRRDRGVMMDGMHMAYAPYCNMFLTNEKAFSDFREKNPHYYKKLVHISEIQAQVVEFSKNIG